MNFLGLRQEVEGQRSSSILSGTYSFRTPEEQALGKKAEEIAERVFGYKQDFSIEFDSHSNYGGSIIAIALHPLFAFTPDQIPSEFVGGDIPDTKVKRWVSKQFRSSVSLEQRAFSTTWKIFRYLAKHPAYFEGVRNFILANEFAGADEGGFKSSPRFFTDIESSSLLYKVTQVLPFLTIGVGALTGNLIVVAFGVATLALRIYGNWKNAKVDKGILLKAVKATGDVKSAIIYYKLTGHYNPRRFDGIRRKTIDRLMGFHDPLRTLDSLHVEHKPKKTDSFTDPFFSRA